MKFRCVEFSRIIEHKPRCKILGERLENQSSKIGIVKSYKMILYADCNFLANNK